MNRLRLVAPVGRLLLPPEVVAGPGALGVVSTLGATRLAIVTSRRVAADPALGAKISRATRRLVSQVVTLEPGEPRLEALRRPLAEVEAFRPDWILAIGGGAVMDGAKLLWALHEHPSLTLEDLARPHALPALRGKARFAAAPTTAGSGSEASSAATFQAAAGARKSFLVSHEILPDVAILDPTLLGDASAGILAASALDAVAHAIEGYVSRSATPLTRIVAETAARALLTRLEAAMDPTAVEARTDLMVGACLAGAVQNMATPGVGHAIAHQLAAGGVPHALATGGLLAGAIRANAAADAGVAARFDMLGKILGLADATGLADELSRLAKTFGIADDLSGRLVAANLDGGEFMAGVMSDPCARANPVALDERLVRRVIADAA